MVAVDSSDVTATTNADTNAKMVTVDQLIDDDEEEYDDDSDKPKRSSKPAGVMRFERNSPPLGTMRFGKRNMVQGGGGPGDLRRVQRLTGTPLGTMRFGKR